MPSQGIYEGILYIVTKEAGKMYIRLRPNTRTFLASKGADLTLLDDIGNQDPKKVMAKMMVPILAKLRQD